MASYNDSWAAGGKQHVQQRQRRMPKESVSLDVKRAFPFRLYGRTRPRGNGV